jgi:hypothetical protein
MYSAALSADGLISLMLAGTVFILTLVSAIHELKDALLRTTFGPRIVAVSETSRQYLFSVIERGYRLRFVSLFVMFAIFVSTVSPVSTLLEIEESVAARTCEGLNLAKQLADSTSVETCKDTAHRSGFSFVESKFGETQNHLLQIAMWPLVATIYGFMIAIHFRFARNNPNEQISTVIERAPHSYHIIHGALVFVTVIVGFVQNAIGT